MLLISRGMLRCVHNNFAQPTCKSAPAVGLCMLRIFRQLNADFIIFPFGEGINRLLSPRSKRKVVLYQNLRYSRPAPLCHMPKKAPARRRAVASKTNPQRQRQKMASKFISLAQFKRYPCPRTVVATSCGYWACIFPRRRPMRTSMQARLSRSSASDTVEASANPC